jgi:O-antigen ligase
MGLVAVAIFASTVSLIRPEFLSSFGGEIVYKREDPGRGFWISREGPWGKAIEMIKAHPWFGVGFGTTAQNSSRAEGPILFASSSEVNAENGSSYLSVLLGVGIIGAIPYCLLLLILIAKVGRTVTFVWQTRGAHCSAVPFAIVVVSCLIHAMFEDWLLAPGNYLCVFFWTLAFILVDVAPKTPTTNIPYAKAPIRAVTVFTA